MSRSTLKIEGRTFWMWPWSNLANGRSSGARRGIRDSEFKPIAYKMMRLEQVLQNFELGSRQRRSQRRQSRVVISSDEGYASLGHHNTPVHEKPKIREEVVVNTKEEYARPLIADWWYEEIFYSTSDGRNTFRRRSCYRSTVL